MVFNDLYILVLWTKIDSALEGLRWCSSCVIISPGKSCPEPGLKSLAFIFALILLSYFHRIQTTVVNWTVALKGLVVVVTRDVGFYCFFYHLYFS